MAAVSHEPEPLDVSPEASPEERTGHPLFPRSEHETGPDRRRIDLIHIERARDDGTWETCPKTFKASDLRSWNDIVDRYGGGAYRARAQCGKTYQWQGTTERKEFAGTQKPFVEESKRAAVPAAAPQNAGPLPYGAPPGWAPPPAAGANSNGPAHAHQYPPHGWAPPLAPNPNEPPPWLAPLLKAIERPAAPPPEHSLIPLLFKAMADRDAIMFKMMAERQGPQASAPPPAALNPLEVIRELKPLLDSNTAPGQFMQGIEIAKSLMHQSAPAAAPPQEDFATALAGIMRTLSPGGGLPFPGMSAPAAPPAASPPPPPPAPVMQMDDMIRMMASDRELTRRFIAELGHRRAGNATLAPPPAAPVYTAAAAAPPPVAAPSHAAPAAPSPTPAYPAHAAPPHAPPPPPQAAAASSTGAAAPQVPPRPVPQAPHVAARPVDPPALLPNDLDVGTTVAAPAPIAEPPAGSSRGAHGQPLAQRRDDTHDSADGVPSLGLDFLDSPEVRAAMGDETSALWLTLTGRGKGPA